MKDLEKIKSEDLGCQVQDANPGNFVIEQEVAQLVGATVHAPTAPSADDARELGAQLLVFLRRALLPIRSALRTAVAAIYAHLDSRCTDYTPAAYATFRILPYDPMRPFVPRTLPNLLTALTAFSARKISGADTIDGISLPRVMFSSAGAATVTEINDTNTDWDIIAGSSIARFVNVEKAIINGKGVFRSEFVTSANIKLKEVYIPGATELRRMYGTARGVFTDCPLLEVIEAENAKDLYAEGSDYAIVYECPKLRKLRLGKLTVLQRPLVGTMPDIVHLEIGAGTAISLNFANWNPTNALSSSASDLVADPTAHPTWKNLDQFLQNFREHIALRLAQQPADNPNHLTLTLSQAVFDTIWNADGTPKSTDPDSVIYQINKIIKTDKHWSVNRA